MSDETSKTMFSGGMDWLEDHRRRYLSSGGSDGHIIDLSFSGGRAFSPHLLIRSIGRKTGRTFITPLFYGVIGGEVVIAASKAGADHHPSWYLNLIADDAICFQIATQAFRATWREPEGEERERIWNFMTFNNPPFAQYQATTQRLIPLVLMRAVEPIAPFTEANLNCSELRQCTKPVIGLRKRSGVEVIAPCHDLAVTHLKRAHDGSGEEDIPVSINHVIHAFGQHT